MPYKKTHVNGYRVTGPSGVHAKSTTKAKAEAQIRLLRGIEHGMKPRTTRQAMSEVHTGTSKRRRRR